MLMSNIQIRLVPCLQAQQLITQDPLASFDDTQPPVRRIVEWHTEVPSNIHQGGYVSEHIDELGGEYEGWRLCRVRELGEIFLEDPTIWSAGDKSGCFLRVASNADMDLPRTSLEVGH